MSSLWGDIARFLSVGSTVLKTGASLYQAKQSRKAAKQQARHERAMAERQAEQKRQEIRRRIGMQRASFAAQGISLAGSPLLLVDETQDFGNKDVSDILTFGNQRARLAEKRAKAAKFGGGLSAVGSLLDGGFDYYKMFEMD